MIFSLQVEEGGRNSGQECLSFSVKAEARGGVSPMRNKLQLVTQPKETSHDKLAKARLPSHGYGYGSDYFPE